MRAPSAGKRTARSSSSSRTVSPSASTSRSPFVSSRSVGGILTTLMPAPAPAKPAPPLFARLRQAYGEIPAPAPAKPAPPLFARLRQAYGSCVNDRTNRLSVNGPRGSFRGRLRPTSIGVGCPVCARAPDRESPFRSAKPQGPRAGRPGAGARDRGPYRAARRGPGGARGLRRGGRGRSRRRGRLARTRRGGGAQPRAAVRLQAHRRRGEALARLRALWLSLRERGPVGLVVDGEPVAARFALVANNAYQLD